MTSSPSNINDNVSDDTQDSGRENEQELDRRMGGFMSFAIGFTEVNAIISVTSIFGYGLVTGGPALIVWGWLISFVMTLTIGYNFAELCSVYPSAGSVYHW